MHANEPTSGETPVTDSPDATNPYASPTTLDEHAEVDAKSMLADELIQILDQSRSAIIVAARLFVAVTVLLIGLALLFLQAGRAGIAVVALLLFIIAITTGVLSSLLYRFAERIEVFVRTREVGELLRAMIYQRRFWRYFSNLMIAMMVSLVVLVFLLALSA